MRRTSPLILGAGPAGTAAAIRLAQGGACPLILEAQAEKGDAICGGFISWRTIQSLESLGVMADQLPGHAVSRVTLFCGDSFGEAPLPAQAMGISRYLLDRMLINRAVQAGAGIEMGVSAKALHDDGSLTLKDGERLTPDSLFIGTGKHELRGLGRERAEDPAVGIRVRLSPHPSLSLLVGGAIELHLFEGGYAGLMLQEDGSGNLCMAVRKSRLTQAGGSAQALLSHLGDTHPHLAERLSFLPSDAHIDAIAAIPYGWRTSETRPGQFRLGDQAACIPSLAGEGNGLALASGIRAADAWLDGGPTASCDFQRSFADSTWRPVSAARILWHLAESEGSAKLLIKATQSAPFLAKVAASLTRIGH
jgi:menaquinone-9 beta-reductase